VNQQTKDRLVLGLAAGAAVVSLYFAFGGRSPKLDLSTYAALGAVVAEETAKLLGNQGQVLVIARDTGAEKNPSLEAELEAFEQARNKHPGLSQVTERFVATPMLMMATGGGVPPDLITKAVETHPKVGALVLFCAAPPLAEAELAPLSKRGVKIVIVSSFRPEYGRLLDQGVIHLAIVPRPEGPPPGTPPPRTLRERFDQDYAIVSAADTAPRR